MVLSLFTTKISDNLQLKCSRYKKVYVLNLWKNCFNLDTTYLTNLTFLLYEQFLLVQRVLNILALKFGNWNERTRASMGIQKSNKTVEIHILPLQTMQTILLWNWFSLIRFFFKLVFLIRFSILSIIIPCSTKKFILFINFVRKFYLFVLTFLFIVDFIAPLALISILFLYGKLFLRYAGIVYLTLPTLNKWINK